MFRQPPRLTLNDHRVPYTPLFRSSIPAGIIMSKLGYIRTFVLGFIIVAAAAFLFIPASAAASYPGFLAALFCIGAGITVLQVAMNPVITTLGPVETSH